LQLTIQTRHIRRNGFPETTDRSAAGVIFAASPTARSVMQGAKQAGLVLDRDKGSRIHKFRPDPLASLDNMSVPQGGLMYKLTIDRTGPNHHWQVAPSAVRRWHAQPDTLPERKPYRPPTLSKVAAQPDGIELPPGWSGDVLDHHVVVLGDELRALANHYYGDPNLWKLIFDASRGVLDDPDELFQGETLLIPVAPDAAAAKASKPNTTPSAPPS
jgi:nucleoid-associated protein YgaU